MRIIFSVMVFFVFSLSVFPQSMKHDFSKDIAEIGRSNFDIDYAYKKNGQNIASQGSNLFTYYVYNNVLFYVNYFLNRQMDVGGKMYYTSYQTNNLPADRVAMDFYRSVSPVIGQAKMPDLKNDQFFVARTPDNKYDVVFLMFTAAERITLVCIVKDRRFVVPESEPVMTTRRFENMEQKKPLSPNDIKGDVDVDAVIQGLLKKYGQ